MLVKNKMTKLNWIEERKARELKSAMQTAIRSYARVEKQCLILSALDKIFEAEDISFEKILDNNWMIYTNNAELQLYSYNDDDDVVEETTAMLLALVEAFGEAKREKQGDQISYTWAKAVHDYDLKLQVNPKATGCKLVKKTVKVPAQPATTRTVYEIACLEEVKVE